MGTTLKHKVVKIKKPHRCTGCSSKFEPGQEMVYYAGVWEGDFQSGYWCKPCDAYMTKYSSEFQDGIMEGEFHGEPHYEDFKKEYLKQ